MILMPGELLKLEGQTRAADKAGIQWAEDALALLCQFIAHLKIETPADMPLHFTFDEFRLWAGDGLEQPASVNAWGSLPRKAVALGLCEETGLYARAGRRAAHARMVRVWRAF